jgi:hypothetical protein
MWETSHLQPHLYKLLTNLELAQQTKYFGLNALDVGVWGDKWFDIHLFQSFDIILWTSFYYIHVQLWFYFSFNLAKLYKLYA